jgi:hypothetical protein
MTEIVEKNKQFAEKEDAENKDLENMVGDIGGSDKTTDEEDIFDKELKESARDDHKSLKQTMIETYKETMKDLT